MSKGGSSGTTQSTGTTTPWADQQPYLNDIFSSAKDLYGGTGPSYYPTSTYAKITPNSSSALGRTADLAISNLEDSGSTTNQAGASENKLLSGGYLGENKGLSKLTDLQEINPGTENAGTGYLKSLLDTNPATIPSGYGTLSDLSETNQSTKSPGYGTLSDLSETNQSTKSPGYGTLSDLSETNQSTKSPGYGTLSDLSETNQSTKSPGYKTLTSLSENPIYNPATGYLQDFADTNPALGSSGYKTLEDLSSKNQATDNIAGDTLTTNSGTNFGTKQYNEGTDYQEGVAKGDRLTKGNPYVTELSDSILAQVIPDIESQFISGGTLSSPETVRATTAGAVAGLAPSLFKNYSDESKNQITAAQNIAGNILKGGEDTTTAANDYGTLNLGGIGYQTDAAKDLLSGYLTGSGQQLTSATALGDQTLQAGKLQSDTADALTKDYLSGSKQQSDTADALTKDYLTGSGQQTDAADALVKDYLSGSKQQSDTADALTKDYLTGSGQQSDAADALVKDYLSGSSQQLTGSSDLGKQQIEGYSAQTTAANDTSDAWNKGVDQITKGLELAPTVQQLPYTDLTQLYTAGNLQQKENQNVLDENVSRWNYGQTLPYDRLNELIGQITGNYGGTTSLTQPYFDNSTSAGSILGTAASGATLLSLL